MKYSVHLRRFSSSDGGVGDGSSMILDENQQLYHSVAMECLEQVDYCISQYGHSSTIAHPCLRFMLIFTDYAT